jgi:2-aminobenzoate-CoA ligase
MFRYEDNFAHDNLPAKDLQPDYIFDDLDFQFPEDLNCAERLLDKHIADGNGDRIAIRTFEVTWTFNDLYEKANQIAHVLTADMGLVSGNRVLIRSANNPMMVACWFGVIKAGGVVVATMPLLREKELTIMCDCAEISLALCDYRLEDEMKLVKSKFLKRVMTFDGEEKTAQSLEKAIADKPKTFQNFKSTSETI